MSNSVSSASVVSEHAQIVGRRLRYLREHSPFSLEEVALAPGVTPERIKEFEEGTAFPNLVESIDLAELFFVSWESIFGK